MADRLSTESRSRIMRAIRSKNTKPELIVRRYLSARGYRYRLHSKRLPGKPDLAFPGRRKAIFVHGCFWHQHSKPGCPIRIVPSSNRHYWGPKLRRNLVRDAEHLASLRKLGWKVLVVWECSLRHDVERVCHRITRFLGPQGRF
jgi:DNA mismatch endonuclease (patch repair protein)